MTGSLDGLELDDAALAQIDAVVRLVGDVRDDVIGISLAGSAVDGGLRPRSDIDLVAMVTGRLTADDRRSLIDGLLALSGRHAVGGPARPLEVTIVVESDVRPWRYPPPMAFQYGDWWRSEFAAGDDAPWSSPNADLAILLESARQRSRPLVGPPMRDLLDAVPATDIRRAMIDELPELTGGLADIGTDRDDTRNILLTLARMRLTLETGRIGRKDEAADWVLARLSAELRPPLELARDAYLGTAADPLATWADLRASVNRTAAYLVEEIRASG